MPVGVDLVWNQANKSNYTCNTSVKIGAGWRLSTVEYIAATTGEIAETFPYVFVDGDGTEHFFMKKDSDTEFYLETNDTVKLIKGTDPILKIVDEQGNEKIFNHTNSVGDAIYQTMYMKTADKDPNGNTRTYNWSQYSQLTSVSDSSGRSVQFSYLGTPGGGNNHLDKITDYAGRETKFYYSSGARHLIKIELPNGDNIDFTYDGADLMTNATNPDGGSLSRCV